MTHRSLLLVGLAALMIALVAASSVAFAAIVTGSEVVMINSYQNPTDASTAPVILIGGVIKFDIYGFNVSYVKSGGEIWINITDESGKVWDIVKITSSGVTDTAGKVLTSLVDLTYAGAYFELEAPNYVTTLTFNVTYRDSAGAIVDKLPNLYYAKISTAQPVTRKITIPPNVPGAKEWPQFPAYYSNVSRPGFYVPFYTAPELTRCFGCHYRNGIVMGKAVGAMHPEYNCTQCHMADPKMNPLGAHIAGHPPIRCTCCHDPAQFSKIATVLYGHGESPVVVVKEGVGTPELVAALAVAVAAVIGGDYVIRKKTSKKEEK